jgi:hypothetical protein
MNILPTKFRYADLVEGLSGFKVTPINLRKDKNQRKVVTFLNTMFHESYINQTTGVKPLAKMNEYLVHSVAKNINHDLKHHENPEFHCIVLDTNSYGDLLICHTVKGLKEYYYLEIITTTKLDIGSSLRYLYMSKLPNIDRTATHLIVIFPVTEFEQGFSFKRPLILDPANLILNLKLEYNASMDSLKALKVLN